MPVKLFTPRRFADSRGWFTESYNPDKLAAAGIDAVFVQDNHSQSVATGTIRGLHYQLPPFAQAKLVRCIRGSVWDVAVDIRDGSSTFGEWTAAILSADNGAQLFIPEGFAHGFVTLEPDSELEYKVTARYSPDHEGGIRWDDPTLALPWPLDGRAPVLSDKDLVLPALAQAQLGFAFDGCPLVPVEQPA